ncbi:MAG: hypothetical protein JWM77_4285 [Rhodospirillales bacterium]|nr:hypothetical protein [Rhodospirillales bacterium]
MAIAIYIVLCLLVGLMAINRPAGFFGYFLLSIFVTPFVTLITLLMLRSIDRRRLRRERAIAAS